MTTSVPVNPPPGREIQFGDFADLTPIPLLQADLADIGFNLIFDGDITAAVQAQIVARAESTNANDETLRNRATTAMANNRTYLNLTQPANADVVAQVAALTRQMNAVIRLVLQQFDGTN